MISAYPEPGASSAALQPVEMAVLDSLHEGIWVLGSGGGTEYLNPAAARLLGIAGREPRGMEAAEILEEGARRTGGEAPERTLEHLDRAVEAGRREEWLDTISADSQQRELFFRAAPFQLDGHAPALLVTLVPADQDAVEEEPPEGWAPQLEFLVGATDILADVQEEEEALDRVAEFSIPTLGERCFVNLVGPDRKVLPARVTDIDPARREQVEEMHRRFPLEGGRSKTLVDLVLRTGEPLRLPQVSDELLEQIAQGPAHLERLRSLRVRSMILVPLSGRGGRVGVMGWISSLRSHSRSDLALAERLAAETAMVVTHIRAYEKLQKELRRRRRSEKALRQSRRWFRGILTHAGDAIFVHEIDGQFIEVNAAACATLGYTREELIGMNIREVVTSRAGRTVPDYRERLARGENVTVEGVHRRKDGSTFPVEVRLALLERGGREVMLAIARDVTDRVEALAALKANEERFRALIENTADAIAVLDESGNFMYHSPSSRWILGYEPEELVGRDARELVHPEERELMGQKLAALRDGESGHTEEAAFRVRHKDGSWLMTESIAMNRLDEPAVRGIVLNYRDVTDRRRLEDQFRQAQKLEAVGRLAGGIAHDFNNILTAIQGVTQIRLEAAAGDRAAEEDLREVLTSADRAAALTRQLLAFSRKQILQPEILPLHVVVREIEGMLRRLIGADIDIRVTAEPIWVNADRGQLEQVILNLVVNARDAMPRGGLIEITTAAADCPDRASLPDGRYAVLTVRDTGTGIPPEILDRIFEPFFTTKEVGRGTGLGLATVYGIVRQSGGDVVVESQPGSGSRFSVVLPLSESRPDAIAEGTVDAPLRHQGETVLLVEDDDALRRLCERILRKHDYQVLAAADGAEAVRICRRAGDSLDVIVTDVVLPDSSGIDLAVQLRQLCTDTPVLFMSGYMGDSLVEESGFEADDGFLQKPFTPAEFAASVARALAQAHPEAS